MRQDLVGILINDSLWQGIQRNHTGHENLDYYQDGGERYYILPCYFRLQDISLKEKTALALVKSSKGWEKIRIPLPSVIHNRAILHTNADCTKLQKLTEAKIHIFNLWNRYSKLFLSRLLEEKEEFHQYLPATYGLSRKTIQFCQSRFNSFLLKPDKGTVGLGIIKVDKKNQGMWEFQCREGNRIKKTKVQDRQLFEKLKPIVGTNKYLVQETIPLATYQGSPFDVRVSVQKGATGEWGVTGMVGKVAKAGHFLSNVAQGGRVETLEQILKDHQGLSVEEVKSEITMVALAFSKYLERSLPHLADIGYDFGMDQSGQLYFIEMNSRDQRYSFAKANMLDTWKKTYENPMAYARYLLDRKRMSR